MRLGFLLLFIISFNVVTGQQKQINLEEIWSGAFRTQGLDELRSLKNGKQYAVLNYNRLSGGSSVDVYDYITGKKVNKIVSSSQIKDANYFYTYTLSEDETKVLLATDLQQIYRRSTLGTYYVYDVATKKMMLVSENKIQEPLLNPAGTKVAYGYNNNIFIKNLSTSVTTQITKDGLKNSIINGITDWVYEEEFAFVRAFEWNKDGSKIGYIKFDETNVPRFSMDVYGTGLYPAQQVFKYPKAGDPNAQVSLHLYDLESEKTSNVDLSGYNSYYIPRIKWTQDTNVLSVQTTNRKQNTIDLIFVDANKNQTSLVLQEKDDAYVDVTDNLTFFKDNSFIWTSERDGWNHIYHFNKSGDLKNQITQGAWEVTNYYGYDPKSNTVFYQSTENGSINRGVYSINAKGKNKKELSVATGTNSAAFSADYSYYINTYQSATTPSVFTLHDAKTAAELKQLKDNTDLANKVAGYKMSEKEFSTISINGNDLNMYAIKPLDFDPSKKYPLFMYQYSGPGSQNVANKWNGTNDYWHQMLAQQGYIVVCIDGRGTGLKGRDFKKVTQLELGKYEVQDQITAANKLGALPYVDANRIGIWGWSYGGFMSSNCLFQGPETFSMAIAVAPVSSWRFYDTIYTERYMSTPQQNPSGYDTNSPMYHVDGLKGKFLLVHGSADDNVHVQNTTRLVEALVQANKQFDWAIYPDKNHGIYGGNTRLHLYTKMTNFIKQNL